MRGLLYGRLAAAIAILFIAGSQAQARELTEGVADLVASLLPAVVNVSVVRLEPVRNPQPGQNPVQRVRTVGSGFFVDPSGLVATNYHVVEGAQEITVTLQDKTLLPARVFAQAKAGDVALLQVQAGHPVPTLRFGNSDEIRVGDPVLAVGNAMGFGGSVSAGIVSALNRDLGETPFDHFIQTDAAINHGNSGGPLFDIKGEVIGVNTMIVAPQQDGGSVGLGFAIPADSVKFAIDRWLHKHLVNPGWLGVQVQEVTPEIAAGLDLGKYSGAVVSGITSGGPAAEAKLQVGDVILTFDGREVTDTRALMRMAARTGVGRAVPVAVWRDRREEQATVTLRTWPTSELGENIELSPPSPSQQSQNYPLGLALAEANDVWRETYQLASDQKGVVVLAVSPTGAGADAGLKPGQVILRVERNEVSTGPEVTRLVEQARKQHRRYVLLLVQTHSGIRWVPLPSQRFELPSQPSGF